MFVRSAFRPGHEQPILAQGLRQRFSLEYGARIFFIAMPGFRGGPASRGDGYNVHNVRQAIADEFDTIATLHPDTRRGAFAIDSHVTSRNCSGREATRLVEATEV
jgi:hypothetical protein